MMRHGLRLPSVVTLSILLFMGVCLLSCGTWLVPPLFLVLFVLSFSFSFFFFFLLLFCFWLPHELEILHVNDLIMSSLKNLFSYEHFPMFYEFNRLHYYCLMF